MITEKINTDTEFIIIGSSGIWEVRSRSIKIQIDESLSEIVNEYDLVTGYEESRSD